MVGLSYIVFICQLMNIGFSISFQFFQCDLNQWLEYCRTLITLMKTSFDMGISTGKSTIALIAIYAELGRGWELITSIAWDAMLACLDLSLSMYVERNALRITAQFATSTFLPQTLQLSHFLAGIWCIQLVFRYISCFSLYEFHKQIS